MKEEHNALYLVLRYIVGGSLSDPVIRDMKIQQRTLTASITDEDTFENKARRDRAEQLARQRKTHILRGAWDMILSDPVLVRVFIENAAANAVVPEVLRPLLVRA